MNCLRILLYVSAVYMSNIGHINGQHVEVNADGEKIVVYDDGGWRYYLPSDSVYILGSESEAIPRQESFSNSDTLTPFVPQKTKLELVSELVESYTERAHFEQERYANVQAKRFYLDRSLEKAKANKEYIGEGEIESIKNQLKEAKEKEKLVKKEVKEANKKRDRGIDILSKSYGDQYRWYDQELGIKRSLATNTEISKTSTEKQNKKDVLKKEKSSLPPKKKIEKEVDIVYSPPAWPCSSESTIDEFTGVRRRDTPLRHFFSYTHDQMLPHLKGAAYVSSRANLTAISGFTFMNVEIVIANEKAKTAVGSIAKGAPITFFFIDGESLTLSNRRVSLGEVDPLQKTTTYLIQMAMDKNSEKMLKKKLLDEIRVIWSRGYEDYEITNVDFWEYQIECLKNGT